MTIAAMPGKVSAQTGPPKPPATLTVASPGGGLVVTIGTEGQVTWSVSLRGNAVIEPSRIAMTLDGGRVLGEKPAVLRTTARSADQVLRPVVRQKRAEVGIATTSAASNSPAATRCSSAHTTMAWPTDGPRALPGDVAVVNEDVALAFAGDRLVYFPEETSLLSHQERLYKRLEISEITPGRFSSLPAMVSCPAA